MLKDIQFEMPPRWHILQLLVGRILVQYVCIKKRILAVLDYCGFHVESKCNTIFFDFPGSCLATIREYAGKQETGEALSRVIYYPELFPRRKGFLSFLEQWWLNDMVVGRAVRNRLRYVEFVLEEEIRYIWRTTQEQVRIASLAGGLADALMKVAQHLDADNIPVRFLILDNSPDAVRDAKERAMTLGVAHLFEIKRCNLFREDRVKSFLSKFRPHITEFMGLLDYPSDEHAIELMKLAQTAIVDNGKLLIGNILMPAMAEWPVLKHLLNWSPEMHFRSVEGFMEMMQLAGLSFTRDELFVEPCGHFLIAKVTVAASIPDSVLEEIPQYLETVEETYGVAA